MKHYFPYKNLFMVKVYCNSFLQFVQLFYEANIKNINRK